MADKTESRKIEPLPDYHALTLGDRWWDTGPWKGPRVSESLVNTDHLFRVQAPGCKHDRCAMTQIECEACTIYSKTYLEEWRKAKEKANANVKV